MSKENILLLKTNKRRDLSTSIQKVLTDFGCIIRMRLGLHNAGDVCSDEGLIILQLIDDAAEIEKLSEALDKIDGVTYRLIQF